MTDASILKIIRISYLKLTKQQSNPNHALYLITVNNKNVIQIIFIFFCLNKTYSSSVKF